MVFAPFSVVLATGQASCEKRTSLHHLVSALNWSALQCDGLLFDNLSCSDKKMFFDAQQGGDWDTEHAIYIFVLILGENFCGCVEDGVPPRCMFLCLPICPEFK